MGSGRRTIVYRLIDISVGLDFLFPMLQQIVHESRLGMCEDIMILFHLCCTEVYNLVSSPEDMYMSLDITGLNLDSNRHIELPSDSQVLQSASLLYALRSESMDSYHNYTHLGGTA